MNENKMIPHSAKTPTPHNGASKGEIAKTVLLPGDPMRAKYIAENFLTDAREVTSVRGMKGFTGKYAGKEVSVMGSGMGGPSAGIYSFELFKFYEAEKIIRIGTAGGYKESQLPGDLIFAMTASTDSNYAYQYALPGTFSPSADFSLLKKATDFAGQKNIRFEAGAILSSDMYSEYNALGEEAWTKWARMGVLAQDMETYALYCNAAYLGKKALSILTMVANCVTSATTDFSFKSLNPMIETALSLV